MELISQYPGHFHLQGNDYPSSFKKRERGRPGVNLLLLRTSCVNWKFLGYKEIFIYTR
jgi:hypothetical protein